MKNFNLQKERVSSSLEPDLDRRRRRPRLQRALSLSTGALVAVALLPSVVRVCPKKIRFFLRDYSVGGGVVDYSMWSLTTRWEEEFVLFGDVV